MAYMSAGGAAAAAAIAQAIKASGAIVRVSPEDFNRILMRADKPLVVVARGGFFKPNYQYLTSYKGLCFFTRSVEQLSLPGSAEVISAGQIWVPG